MRLLVKSIIAVNRTPFILLLQLTDDTFALTTENTIIDAGYDPGLKDSSGIAARYTTYGYAKRAFDEMVKTGTKS